MDDLPKTNPNDISSFTGIYPGDVKSEPPPTGGQPAVQPSSSAPVEFAPIPPTGGTPESPLETPVSSEPQPFVVSEALPPTQEMPTFSPTPPTTTPSPETPLGTGNEVTPPKPKGGGIKRILLVLFLLIIVVGIGYLLFQVVGRVMTQSQPLTLTYWGLWEDEAVMVPLIAQYKKTHPKVEVVYTKQSQKQYRERLQAAITRGDGPDIFRFHNTWVPMFKDDLAPAGKTSYGTGEFQQIFYPVATQDLIIGGKIYGVPLMFDGLGLYYNEDLLRAAGVTSPTTWEDFRQAAIKLTVKDETGKINTAGAALGTAGNIEHFSDILAVMMLQNGADLKNPATKEGQDALSFYHLFAEKPNNVWDETLDNSILAFANGKVAFMFAPSWQAFTVKQINQGLKFQIIPIPQLPGTNITWASYWVEGVSSKSKHTDEAWEFLKFISSREQMVNLYTETTKIQGRFFGEPYSRVDLAQTLSSDPFAGAYVKQAPTAKSFFLASRTFDNGINDRMIKYLEDTVNSLGKGVSAQGALETASAGFKQVLTSFGAATVLK